MALLDGLIKIYYIKTFYIITFLYNILCNSAIYVVFTIAQTIFNRNLWASSMYFLSKADYFKKMIN